MFSACLPCPEGRREQSRSDYRRRTPARHAVTSACSPGQAGIHYMTNVELNQTQASESVLNSQVAPECVSEHPNLSDGDYAAAQQAWDIARKARQKLEAASHEQEAMNQQESVELAKKIDRGELHPGLLFNDRFELQCLRPLSEWIVEGADAVANLPHPALTPEEKAVAQSAIKKIRAFQAAGQPMSKADDAAVVKPVSIDTEIQDAIHLASQIVAGEVHPASIIDTEGEVQGPETFRAWMKPGAKIEAHRLLSPQVRAVIESAAKRIFAVRRHEDFRTAEEEMARRWLDDLKCQTQLEDALARMGTGHQMARYRAGLLNLYEEAKPLLEEETFAPLRSLHLSRYVDIIPEDVLAHMYGEWYVNLDEAQLEEWIVGGEIITDRATHEERDLMEQIQTLLPRSDIILFQYRLGMEDSTAGEFMFCRCRNGITVTVPTEHYLFIRSFASPRGDYFRPC